MNLRGKADPITAYPLVEVLPEARRGVPGLSSPMVGRDRELEALTSLFEESIETNRPRLVTVFGPAGIGKSRLVQEFVRLASSLRPEAAVLRGRCLSAGHGITYWALGEILRAACGIALDDSVDEAEQKLRSGLSEILSALDLREDELVQTMFGLATTAGISLQDNPLERMEPRAVADEIGRAWPRFASAYASRAPLVIAVEDLHWAGEQLLDMLKRILARSSGPLVLVATARPEFAQSHPGFVAGREDASSISLRPLTPEQGVRLIEGLLTIADIPGELREDLFAKAEGNPFFLEEIIRRLIDEGALVREGDRWRATPAARQTSVPDTIHGLLAARVDGLPPLEKQVLQEAAVVGRVFWEEPVAQSLGNGSVSAALLELERKGLVFARPTSSIRRADRVHVQACARSRRRVRESAEGEAGPGPCGARSLDRAAGRGQGRRACGTPGLSLRDCCLRGRRRPRMGRRPAARGSRAGQGRGIPSPRRRAGAPKVRH